MEFLMGDFYVFFHVIHASCKVALIIITFKGNSGEPMRLKISLSGFPINKWFG